MTSFAALPPVSDHEIQQALACVRDLEPKVAAARKQSQRDAAHLRKLDGSRFYLESLLAIRGVGRTFDLWPIGLTLCVPAIAGALMWGVAFGLRFSFGISLIFIVLAMTTMAAICFHLLWQPPTYILENKLQRLNSELIVAREVASTSRDSLRAIEEPFRLAVQKHQELATRLAQWQEQYVQSEHYRRQQLFALNWRAMRSVEFEQYLKQVFEALGYDVEDTKVSGDQGIDLIVRIGTRRLAVQVKGYFNSVGNSAVQEAYAGCRHYQCQVCAVVTNSRFTASARELAASVGCILIDEERMEDLVMGRIPF
jgi:hypothetical protein